MLLYPHRARLRAFTLVELLVVIGIISVLVGILLPTLGRARAAAQATVCLSNLRSIGQALNLYTSENKGYFPGSGSSSGAGIWSVVGGKYTINPGLSLSNAPGVNEALDWAGPIARSMGKKQFTEGPLATDGVERFKAYCELKEFLCPSYAETFWTVSSGSANTNVGQRQAFSYVTGMFFMTLPWSDGQKKLGANPASNGFTGNVYSMNESFGLKLPTGYVPKLSKVGNGAAKAFMADGARRSVTSNMNGGPLYRVYALRTDMWNQASNQNQTMFSDWGPPFAATKAFDRSGAPGVNTRPEQDVRLMAFRHGKRTPWLPSGSYRVNVAFFDGHVESLDDLAAANPALWMPKGSSIDPTAAPSSDDRNGTATALFSDVIRFYRLEGFNSTNPYIVP